MRACMRTFLVHARHLRGLAADQRAIGLLAAARDALDDFRRHRHVELAACVVVEEVQRLGALHEKVIYGHRDEVDAWEWGSG